MPRRRQPGGPLALGLFAGIALMAGAVQADRPGLHIEFHDADEVGVPTSVVVRDLDRANLAALGASHFQKDRWPALFAVYVDFDGAPDLADRPALAGTYRVEQDRISFTPRFPLEPGVAYLVVFDPAKLPIPQDIARIEQRLTLPKPASHPSTTVTHVYPSGDLLPENLLKFYLHFSAPMAVRTAYDHIRLLDASGKAVEMPFLELGEELWDPSGTRLTLLFDPGRIKKGLKPREESGPILEAGKTYTLAVDASWKDAAGNPLAAPFRETFRAGPEDDQPPDPRSWTINPPRAGTNAPLVVTSPEPLDRALFGRLIAVQGPKGSPLYGRVVIDRGETRWRFVPEDTWAAGTFQILVGLDLEDLAGNSVGRPFEVDAFRPIGRRIESKSVSIPFIVESTTP